MTTLLISGIPGSGKSTFCRWLATAHGYLHVDTDLEWHDPSVRMLLAADENAVVEAARAIRSRSHDVALEWGFDPALAPSVARVIHEGFDGWWFGGDEIAARQAFSRAHDDDVAALRAFDEQIRRINNAWPEIERLFAGRILTTVFSGPRHTPEAEVFRAVCG